MELKIEGKQFMTLTTKNGMTFEGTIDEIVKLCNRLQIVSNDEVKIDFGKSNAANSDCATINDNVIGKNDDFFINKNTAHSIDPTTFEPYGSKCNEKMHSQCEHYKNGYCTSSVLCSYPPKYQRCKFCGDVPLYKFCSEV